MASRFRTPSSCGLCRQPSSRSCPICVTIGTFSFRDASSSSIRQASRSSRSSRSELEDRARSRAGQTKACRFFFFGLAPASGAVPSGPPLRAGSLFRLRAALPLASDRGWDIASTRPSGPSRPSVARANLTAAAPLTSNFVSRSKIRMAPMILLGNAAPAAQHRHQPARVGAMLPAAIEPEPGAWPRRVRFGRCGFAVGALARAAAFLRRRGQAAAFADPAESPDR